MVWAPLTVPACPSLQLGAPAVIPSLLPAPRARCPDLPGAGLPARLELQCPGRTAMCNDPSIKPPALPPLAARPPFCPGRGLLTSAFCPPPGAGVLCSSRNERSVHVPRDQAVHCSVAVARATAGMRDLWTMRGMHRHRLDFCTLHLRWTKMMGWKGFRGGQQRWRGSEHQALRGAAQTAWRRQRGRPAGGGVLASVLWFFRAGPCRAAADLGWIGGGRSQLGGGPSPGPGCLLHRWAEAAPG